MHNDVVAKLQGPISSICVFKPSCWLSFWYVSLGAMRWLTKRCLKPFFSLWLQKNSESTLSHHQL